MPKKSTGALLGSTAFTPIGLEAGGYSCRLDVTIGANPGYMILSTDEGGVACYRNPGQKVWKQLFRYGDNIPASEEVQKGGTFHAYWVARSSSNPNVMVASMYGKAYVTSSGGEPSSPGACDAWTLLTAYKGGVPDATLHHGPHFDARLRGPTAQIDPVNEDIWLLGNPVDSARVTTNRGTSITLVASIPAPVADGNNRYGVNFAFDLSTASGGKTQTVYCSSAGNGIRRSTTGADGLFSDIGGPTTARDMFAAGGVLWVCDSTQRVWKWDGSTWTKQQEGGGDLLGSTIAVDPNDPLKAVVVREGGGMAHTTNGGTLWTQRDDTFAIGSGDPRWGVKANVGYMSPGMMRWTREGGKSRLCLSMGIGYCEFDNPPRVSATTKWRFDSLGIYELIPTMLHFTANGNLLAACHDRALWGWSADRLHEVPADHGPNYADAITHGTDVDSIPGDPDFCVAARYHESANTSYFRHYGGGVDGTAWELIPTPGVAYKGGNIVALSRTNYIIVSSAQDLTPMFTKNGGTTWTAPVFRLTPGGTVVNMLWAWGSNRSYDARRKVLLAVEGEPSTALLFVSGTEGGSGDNRSGVWQTTDGGENWVRIFAGHMNDINLDYYAAKMRRVPGLNNCYFWTAGAIDGPMLNNVRQPSGPAMWFTNNRWSTRTKLTAFDEVFDVCVGPSDTNASGQRTNPFGWVYVFGWRSGGAKAVWISTDFNPANPTSATWSIFSTHPGGRADFDHVMVANPKRPGEIVVGVPAGGAYRSANNFTARAA